MGLNSDIWNAVTNFALNPIVNPVANALLLVP